MLSTAYCKTIARFNFSCTSCIICYHAESDVILETWRLEWSRIFCCNRSR